VEEFFMAVELIRSIDTGDSKIRVGVFVAEITTSSPSVDLEFNETAASSPDDATETSLNSKPVDEKIKVIGNLLDAGKLSLKLPFGSV
jgi:hypothetical protein